jgi:hypothetical protein
MTNDRHYSVDGEEQLWRVAEGEPPRLYTRDDGWQPLVIWGMGIASYDLTGDGYPEVFLTSQGDNKLQMLADGPDQPNYRDVAIAHGVTAHRPYAGDVSSSTLASGFQDVNNDGNIDLFISKGNVDAMPEYATRDPSNLLLGRSDGTFVEVGDAAGIVSFERGRGAALVDLNLDGMLDLVQVNRRANVSLWRNVGWGTEQPDPMGNWIAVPLRPPGDRSWVGVWITTDRQARGDDRRRSRERRFRRIHVGIGEADSTSPAMADGETGSDGDRRQRFVMKRGAAAPVPWRPPAGRVTMAAAQLADVRLLAWPVRRARDPAAVHRDVSSGCARMARQPTAAAATASTAQPLVSTGFDPARGGDLVVGTADEPAILVGNECYGMAGAAPLPMRRCLFQDFSLPGQPRDRSRALSEILADEGVRDGSHVGVVGWKGYADRSVMEAPAFIVDELRRLTRSGIVERRPLLIGAPRLRVINEADVPRSSTPPAGPRSGLPRVDPRRCARTRPRLSGERQPAVCHLIDERDRNARLLSPGDRRIERGDRFTVAFGIWARSTAGRVRRRGRGGGRRPSATTERLWRCRHRKWHGARVGQTGACCRDRRPAANDPSGSS